MKAWVIVCDAALLLLAVLAIFFWNPIVSCFGACRLYTLTGLYCAGCGTTRMFFALRKWDILTAFFDNPLVFLLLCYLVLALVFCNLAVFHGGTFYKKLLNAKTLWIIAIASVLFTVLRNIPVVPFTYLAP